VFGGIQERFDLIVSNPPYVPDSQIGALQAEVRDFEPIAALSGGADGLGIVRRIVDEAPRHLKPGGRLLIEIGFDQADRVRNLFEPQIWSSIDLLPDLQGIPRIARARLK
jgi:release factor glutamine methyltransferase